MRKIAEILGVPFDVMTMNDATDTVMGFFDDGKKHIVCTPNPEIVMEAQRDKQLMQILKAADLVVADGVGVVWASKYSAHKLPERVSGYDLAQKLFAKMEKKGKSVYFFGGDPGTSSVAAKKIKKLFPELNIVGCRNGYFSAEDERKIISEIKALEPDLLLVGLGSPKQEKWIYENLRIMGVKVAIGVGGSFDVMSGKVKRAPIIFRKLGLEWFYRLVSQPKRAKRMLRLPKFVLKVLINK